MRRKYYVICEDDCKVEGMTKEQTIAAIAEATGNVPQSIDEAFISQLVNQKDGSSVKVWKGTRAEYNALTEKDAGTIYHITDDKTGQDAYNLASDTKNALETHIAADGYINIYTQNQGVLIGTGSNGKFKATAAGTFSKFTIGGIEYAVKAGEETELDLVSDVWYSFILDTGAQTINFKSGGGVSNSKLSATTAAAGDVLSNKTFYSGNKELKTGTLSLSGNAAAGDVLTGKTFYNTDAKTKQTGTMPSKAAATYGAKTSAQTIAAGQYLSGAQTIAAVTQTNLTAANIVKGKTVTIKSNNANLWNITGTGTGISTLTEIYSGKIYGSGETFTYTTTEAYPLVIICIGVGRDGSTEAPTITASGFTIASHMNSSYSGAGGGTVYAYRFNAPSGAAITVKSTDKSAYGYIRVLGIK